MKSDTIAPPIRIKPHAPRGGWAQRLLGPCYITGFVWYRLHYFATRLPDWFIALAVWCSTGVCWLVLRRIRAAVAHNLAVVLGPCGFVARQRRIWRTFHEFAWCQTERYEQFRPGKDFRCEFTGPAALSALEASPLGFVFFTAHFGNWEMGPLVQELPRGRRIHAVREPEASASAQRFVEGLFARHPSKSLVMHFTGADLALGAQLLLALRKGDVIGMPGDRPRTGARTIRSCMFGRSVEMPPGPALLARAAGAALVPIFVFREGRRHYRIEARTPFQVACTDRKDADLQAAVDRIARECEAAIRERPHHWFRWVKLL